MIHVENLSKSFGPVKAVQDVSFEAPDGLITGLLGPNGAGKSTTMRLIAGVLEADSGRTTIDGYETGLQSLDALGRLGVLTDSQGLYQRLSARENIRYFGRLHGLGGQELERRIDQLIGLLEMEEIANRHTEGFSTGEKVKVALARALVHQPQNVMLDEPTVGLDVMSTRAVRGLIRRLREEGNCILFSSHIMQEVAMLCDHIVVIAHGRVVAQGTPDDIRQRTGHENLEDAFVAIIGTKEGLI